MTSSSSPPPQWPPEISDQQREQLTLLATTYALSHGLICLPPANVQPPAPTSAIHAPLALFPSPFPRKQFELAKRLQREYNVLYARVAMDEEFLDRVMGAERGVGRVDEFTGHLWRIWKSLRDQGIHQSRHLGLFRSDYLLHSADTDGAPTVSLKQVEFNTISSSFGALSQNVAQMHRYLAATTEYFNSSPYLKPDNLPPNETIAGLVEGLASAHRTYGATSAWILFVVQPGERNVFDQRWLEYELIEKHSIHVIRQTFDELAVSAQVLTGSRVLQVRLPGLLPDGSESVEISTVYFRAGYTPNDYPTPRHYSTRQLLESSVAIQCPSIPLQLAGGKKVQQVLTQLGEMERFLHDVSPDLRSTWMNMWALKEPGGDHTEGVIRARQGALNLVLKPQREGGGNNVYKEDITSFLDTLPESEQEAWIAMELIKTPEGLGNYLVRAGSGTEGAVKAEVVSELGIFGWALFGGPEKSIEEKEVGWLLRTKGKDSNEGGVAAGFSVLDSLVLVD
ncbi:glutathione synthase [Lentinus tigrinus ALCF2SS1-7]|uniref:Glutathione synthetase n=1 Tax=Lentinus tigrinus ALCF2SS1-6 TaxID=1328759 RepID=A0A5C2SS97_9APHY|nr:glutathione synthase [Lentinus tigrinus ALCF2SS1-6]RPD80131.1 glutathione synthase [Lentinus tigrinus ALCF2SS1-7]